MLTTVEKSGDWETNTHEWPGLWRGAFFRIKPPSQVDKEAALAHAGLLNAKRLAKLESRWKAKERRLGNQ